MVTTSLEGGAKDLYEQAAIGGALDDSCQREAMSYDVVIVGAGPAGLAAAIRLKQLAAINGGEIAVAVLEKGSEVGAHIVSGAVIDPRALNELIPDWRDRGAPLRTKATRDKFLLLTARRTFPLPMWAMPSLMHNKGNEIGSLGALVRWLAHQAEALGVDIYPGMSASHLLIDEQSGAVKGVVTGVVGIDRHGKPTANYQPGVEVTGKYVLIAEGARGSLAKTLIATYDLSAFAQPQKFGLGLKELWQVPVEKHQPGLVQHTVGWPLSDSTGGGGFLYHFGDRHVSVGLVVHLNYANPHLSPFDEFQRFKHHPAIARHLDGGVRISYGARAITEGGLQSIPALTFPGGALIGCSAGFVNVPRIKGSHNAMKTGMLAAEAVHHAIGSGRSNDELPEYEAAFRASWVYEELKLVRNAKPILSRLGTLLGGLVGMFDMWVNQATGGFSFFGTLTHGSSDSESMALASAYRPIEYPRPDGKLSFDKPSSVYLSGTNHFENQPAHLRLIDPSLPIEVNLPTYGEPARLYCPAGVYEVLSDAGAGQPRFQINAQNCVHCKTCDIKDPSRNIVWTTPQGGGGPNYSNM